MVREDITAPRNNPLYNISPTASPQVRYVEISCVTAAWMKSTLVTSYLTSKRHAIEIRIGRNRKLICVLILFELGERDFRFHSRPSVGPSPRTNCVDVRWIDDSVGRKCHAPNLSYAYMRRARIGHDRADRKRTTILSFCNNSAAKVVSPSRCG